MVKRRRSSVKSKGSGRKTFDLRPSTFDQRGLSPRTIFMSVPQATSRMVQKQILQRRLGDVDVGDIRARLRGNSAGGRDERAAAVGVEIGAVLPDGPNLCHAGQARELLEQLGCAGME